MKTPLVMRKKVTFQFLRRTIIEGIFAGLHDGFFIVTNAEIKRGEKHL